jgi:thiosulfate dehydrogenase
MAKWIRINRRSNQVILEKDNDHKDPDYLEVIARLINVIIILLVVIVLLVVINVTGLPRSGNHEENKEVSLPPVTKAETPAVPAVWHAPDTTLIDNHLNGKSIKYGRALIANTSYYFGPQGKIMHSTNGMNCQNCHLDAGTKPFGNNYSAVASTYPKFRERSGGIETIEKRVTDCFERSLNGKAPDSMSKEMHAIVAYITWLGKDVTKGERPEGAGLTELTYMSRPADPVKGKKVYDLKCKSCHFANGEGQLNDGGVSYKYPPLWGSHSYNTGAGLYRLSRFAGYVKSNMPQGAGFQDPQLSDEEAWDVAAFVNSQPRPTMDLRTDWPRIAGKPVDHPFGPFADNFTERQHKYGPFEMIAEVKKKLNKK